MSTLSIENCAEYDSAIALGKFLRKLGLSKGSKLVFTVTRRFGDEFERCNYCDFPHRDCTCDPDESRRYDQYDDEAAF